MDIEKAMEQLNTMQQVPQTMDFVVKDDFVKNLPQILSNVKELGEWAKRQTEADRNLILSTDKDFETAKKRCADINRVVKSIEDKRKQVKKEYNAPYDMFEQELKEVTAVLNATRDNLWGQITKAEQEMKDKLEKHYRNYFESKVEENGISSYRTWSQIFDAKWLNKGRKANTVLEEIDGKIATVKNELTAIKALQSEFESVLLVRYAEGHTMADIITYNSRIKAKKQAVETGKQEVRENTQLISEKTDIPTKETVTDETEEIFATDFRVWTTKQQLAELGRYLRENGIKYGKVD